MIYRDFQNEKLSALGFGAMRLPVIDGNDRDIDEAKTQERLISGLDLKDTIYFGSRPSNIVPMQGKLPKHKQAMLEAVREKREQLRRHLDEYPQRGGEGSILNR